jgi:hypothetical protein
VTVAATRKPLSDPETTARATPAGTQSSQEARSARGNRVATPAGRPDSTIGTTRRWWSQVSTRATMSSAIRGMNRTLTLRRM